MSATEAKALLAALKLAKAGTRNHGSSLPVLHCAHLADGILTATDLDITVRIAVDYTGPALLLPIVGAIDALKGAKGSVDVTAGDELVRIGGASLKGYPLDEFPKLERADAAWTMDLDPSDRVAFASAMAAASTDDSRPILTGVLVSVADGVLSIVATDSYRLAITDRVCDAPAWTMLVPARALKLALKAGAVDRVSADAREVTFTGAGVEITARLIDGDFPRYQRLIPKAGAIGGRLVVDAAELRSAAQAAAQFVKRDACPLRLEQLSTDGVVCRTIVQDRGEIVAPIGTPDADGPCVSFNPGYLADGLAGLSGAVLSFVDTLKPATITSDERPGWLYLLMPVRGDDGKWHGLRTMGDATAAVAPVAPPKRVRAPKVAQTTPAPVPVAVVSAPEAPAVDPAAWCQGWAAWAQRWDDCVAIGIELAELAARRADEGRAVDVAAALEADPDLYQLVQLSPAQVRAQLWERVAAGLLSIDDAMDAMDATYAREAVSA